jgi:hypothetical protein
MKRITRYLCLAFSLASLPAVAKTHKDSYTMACPALWPAVKDVLKLSGKYNIIGIDSTEMTASFTVGSVWSGKMLNSVVLNPQGTGCELIVNTAYRGVEHNDAGDFKKRIDEALTKSPSTPDATPAPAK